jgi:hypothetical protein
MGGRTSRSVDQGPEHSFAPEPVAGEKATSKILAEGVQSINLR